jgi:hypothetical protein
MLKLTASNCRLWQSTTLEAGKRMEAGVKREKKCVCFPTAMRTYFAAPTENFYAKFYAVQNITYKVSQQVTDNIECEQVG